MKKVVSLLIIILPLFSKAQNVGVGTLSPLEKLHVNGGNFLIQESLQQTSAAPTVGQTITMVNGLSISLNTADSVNKIYDPGGAGGNYLANLSSGVNVGFANYCVGFEVTIVSIDLGLGDSLIISEQSLWRNVQLSLSRGYSPTGTFTFSTNTLYFTFTSNDDASSTGSGFEIIIKRKYKALTGTAVNAIAGNTLLYDSRNSFLFAGRNNIITDGVEFTTAIGSDNTLHTNFSTAIGRGLNDFYRGSGTLYIGSWNAEASQSGGPLLVVGNGGNNNLRSNALEVYKDGTTLHNGWVMLGDHAPRIKTALITGYNMPNTDNSWVFIPLPAEVYDVSLILSFSVIVTDGIYQFIPNTTHPNFYFRTNIDQRNVAVGTFSGQSSALYGKPIKVFITYGL